MGLADLINRQNPESGITARYDRHHKFRIRRRLDHQGFHVYLLENISRDERIVVPRFIFDRFRAAVREALTEWDGKRQTKALNINVSFKSKSYFHLQSSPENPAEMIIQDLCPETVSTGFLLVSHQALPTLDQLLFHEGLDHPNDILDKIIAYHKLFQFSFVDGSDSMTSDLAVRRDILTSVERYVPSLGKRLLDGSDRDVTKTEESQPGPKKRRGESAGFRSQLAAKSQEKDYAVDYEALFAKGSLYGGGARQPKAPDHSSDRDQKKIGNWYPLPLVASEVKRFTSVPFKCEYSPDEINELREGFLKHREHEYFAGFEIVDAIFKTSGGVVKTFRFPLYYFPVEVQESGRNIYVEPLDGSRININHLGLANLVAAFGIHVGGQDPIDAFFRTLLAQKIEVDGRLGRIYLCRSLPFAEEIFDRTREVLLGKPGENGLGGILSGLKVQGIECDLESVNLYRSPKIVSPIMSALEHDLDEIQAVAHATPSRFYGSLLGKFMSPEIQSQKGNTPASGRKGRESEGIARRPWIPGALPPSTRRLLGKLNGHDLVLLEGPPGTGKTFTIMNLFIHSVCAGKRLLVVSDQMAATHALTEKIQEYLMGKDRESPSAKNLEILWRTAIKVVDQVPSGDAQLGIWLRDLKSMLGVDSPKELGWPSCPPTAAKDLVRLDHQIRLLKQQIEGIMQDRLGPGSDIHRRVAQKRDHDTTVEDISSLVAFLRFMGGGRRRPEETGEIYQRRYLVRRFIKDREVLASSPELGAIYGSFQIPPTITQEDIQRLSQVESLLKSLVRSRPRSVRALEARLNASVPGGITVLLRQLWVRAFPPSSVLPVRALRVIASLIHHPLVEPLDELLVMFQNFKKLLKLGRTVDDGVWRQLRIIHDALQPGSEAPLPLSLEICRFITDITFDQKRSQLAAAEPSIQELLERIAVVQHRRDKLVKQQFIGRLGEIARGAFELKDGHVTNAATSIVSHLESLKSYNSLEAGRNAHKDLQQALLETFPVWVARKQAVPFLFPTVENSFDLIVVDEATQCRVDDALPLLFRARKLMVVGDEKQTVLAKNSVIDDYLFKEFNLDEHLRTTQARGIKGGGSHIFGLVKSIKQASVMLDEHYRCPPDIIEFSNKYVYGNELKIMQWTPLGKSSSVVVDWRERSARKNERRESGKYKGLETDMIDRYLDWVATTIKQIEKETGHRIRTDTDVALCYFLLKNELYIKDVKGEWLRKLGRGDDILDGAGAALQGKERDYIFYLWDINRRNMGAFRQGDDDDKRKGELNVLMSRPKKRAYHYIHKDFDRLDHHKATITDYLWRTYSRQQMKKEDLEERVPRTQKPGPEFIPWRRSSGQLMASIAREVLSGRRELGGKSFDTVLTPQYSVVVGDPRHRVDLVLMRRGGSLEGLPTLGVVDLAGFHVDRGCANDVVDYYFQLQRAAPPIRPVFLFMHELADERSRSFRQLARAVRAVLYKEAKDQAS